MTLRELRKAIDIDINKLNIDNKEVLELTTKVVKNALDYLVTEIIPYTKVVKANDDSSVKISCGICVCLEKTEQDRLIEQLIENEDLCAFDSASEMMDFLNKYDYQDFKTQEEMLIYIDGYYFRHKDVFYYINFDEAKEKLKQVGLI